MSEIDNATTALSALHIDCSNGISQESLLAACLNAANPDFKVEAVNNIIQDSLKSHINLINTYNNNNNNNTMTDLENQKMISSLLKIRVENQHESGGLVIVNVPNNDPQSCYSITAAVTKQQHYDRIIKRINNLAITLPVGKATKVLTDVLTEINKANERIIQSKLIQDEEEEKEKEANNNNVTISGQVWFYQEEYCLCLYYILTTMRVIHHMNIGHISYSPLPVHLATQNNSPLIQELLKGMCINTKSVQSPNTTNVDTASLSSSSFDLSLIMSLAFLRVLTGSDRNFATSMIYQKKGIGYDPAIKVSVNVVVGKVEIRNEHANHHHLISQGQNDEQDLYVSDQYSNSQKTTGRDVALWHSDSVAQMETNVDDMTGEVLAFVIENLMNNGALDAWVTPIVMKKGRPAHTLHCLCQNDEKVVNTLIEIIFRQTTTLGIRVYRNISRVKLERSIVSVKIPYTKRSNYHSSDPIDKVVKVKIAKFRNGEIISRKAEFEDCKQMSIESGIPLKDIAHQAVVAASSSQVKDPTS